MSNQFKKMHKNKGGDRGRQMGRKNQKPETKDQELDSNDLRMDMREISKRIELLGMSNSLFLFTFHEILLFLP
ncbi:hypothetical protein RchiOBHm_Chr2g0121561 [Rosa chinensis]|uniref:Uncharacterized protein n=1 Tax=Rosa chinensis TaxID=74649 RepID=A0A2P6RSK5_ROSCH|nr:hypothetical protein RchiOBHm_Chr2g0121561 [Rosa chinensis]